MAPKQFKVPRLSPIGTHIDDAVISVRVQENSVLFIATYRQSQLTLKIPVDVWHQLVMRADNECMLAARDAMSKSDDYMEHAFNCQCSLCEQNAEEAIDE